MSKPDQIPDTEKPRKSLTTRLLERVKLTDTLLIAAIPVAGYIVHFTYTAGYLSIFGIPIALIEFSLNDLFMAIFRLVLPAYVLFIFGDLVISAAADIAEPIRDRVLRVMGGYLFFFALFLLFPSRWKEWIGALVVLAALVLYHFGWPLIAQRGKGNYIDKLRAQDEKRENAASDGYESSHKRLLRLFGPFVFLLPVALMLVYNAGRSHATTTSTFRVANTTPETVVLYMTNSRFVVSPFDRTTQTIKPSFVILPIDNPDIADIEFHNEKVGPLAVSTPTPTPSLTPTPTHTSLPTALPTSTPNSTSTPTPVRPTIPAPTTMPSASPRSP